MKQIIELKENDNLTLEATFSEGEVKIYDLKPILKCEVFKPLADISTFKQVRNRGYYIEWGDDTDALGPLFIEVLIPRLRDLLNIFFNMFLDFQEFITIKSTTIL